VLAGPGSHFDELVDQDMLIWMAAGVLQKVDKGWQKGTGRGLMKEVDIALD